jgi:hypothetical protein
MAAVSLECRRIEAEPDTVDGLEVDLWVGLEVFAKLGDEYVHASAEEIIVFSPDVEQNFLPLEDTVGMLAKEF